GQVRTQDVTDPALISALLEVPRERFVPAARAELAYLDIDRPVTEPGLGGPVRHLLKVMVLAKLLQAAQVTESDSVLDVGCATGYSSAILARLARKVVSLEEDKGLAGIAERTLRGFGYGNVRVVAGPLSKGVPEE